VFGAKIAREVIMNAIIHILEHLPALFLALGFIFVAIPAGWAAISGFLGIMASFARGKEADYPGEVKVGRVSFKGPVRLGLVVLAVIFALIALRDSEHKTSTSEIPDYYRSGNSYRGSHSSDERVVENGPDQRRHRSRMMRGEYGTDGEYGYRGSFH
jgi:hypothetical protein